jgi:DNA-binding NarL/FixJ family response regulator
MKILTCDDHDLFREGLRGVVSQLEGAPELLEAGDAEEALRVVEAHEDVGLVLLDLGLPGASGLSLLRTLRKRFPFVAVMVVSASEEPADIRAALDAGATGFVPKTSKRTVLLRAIELVLAGGVYVPPAMLRAGEGREDACARRERVELLTPRQRDVLRLMQRGLTNKEIGDVLGISAATVKVHVAAILETLDVSNRTEAAMAMAELGLLDAEDF